MKRKTNRHIDEIIRRRKHRVLIYATVIAIVLGLCYLSVWERVSTLQLADEHSHRRQTVYQLKEKCRQLEYEINQLSSLRRIEEIARRDLSLVPVREALLANFTAVSHKIETNKVVAVPKAGKQVNAQISAAGKKVHR